MLNTFTSVTFHVAAIKYLTTASSGRKSLFRLTVQGHMRQKLWWEGFEEAAGHKASAIRKQRDES